MKKKIIFSIILFITAIIFIALGVILFNLVPNIQQHTPKEELTLFGSYVLFAIGGGLFIGNLVCIGLNLSE